MVRNKLNVGISTLTVCRHKLTSLHVSSFIANQNEKAVMISIVGLNAAVVGDTKLTSQQRLSLLRTLGLNVGSKVYIGISTLTVSRHKLTSLHASSFITNQNKKAAMIGIVGLNASVVGDTKPLECSQ